MADSSSVSATSTLSGLRLSGSTLFSGLDTESIVKQMASATKSKINKAQQKVDSLTWKQSSYRDIISKISSFQDKYLGTTGSISTNKAMAAYKATSSSSSVTATASPNATAASYKITSVTQLAEGAEIASDFGGGTLTSGIQLDLSGTTGTYTAKVTLDGYTKVVSFTEASGTGLLAGITAAFGADTGANFAVSSDGVLSYDDPDDTISHTIEIAKDTTTVDTDTTDEATARAAAHTASMTAIGLTTGGSNKITTGTKLSSICFSTELAGGSYNFKINGAEFTFDDDTTIAEMISKINNDDTANATLTFDSLAQTFSLTSDLEGTSSALDVQQTSGNLLTSMFGSDFAPGTSISTVSLMEGEVTGSKLTSTDFTNATNKKIEITVNGVTKTIGFPKRDNNGNEINYADVTSTDDDGNTTTTPGVNNAISSLNQELEEQFGVDYPYFDYDTTTGKVSLISDSVGDIITINAVADDIDSTTLLTKLGFSGTTTNAVSEDTTLADALGSTFKAGSIYVNGTELAVSSTTTLAEVETAFGDNVSIDYKTGTITFNEDITATTDDGKALVEALFNNDYDDVAAYSSTFDGGTTQSAAVTDSGKNAILTINGTTITYSSNTIEFNGTSINIGDMTAAEAAAVTAAAPITITTTRDTSEAYDSVVAFVDAYNTLIKDLYTAVDTKRPTDDGTVSGTKYDPLTEEQKDEMSEDQITAWEEKAKTGLLYNDSTTLSFLTKLRTAMNTRTSDNFSLIDMGISVSNEYRDNGMLIIDEDALEQAFEENPDKIQEFFVDSSTGLAAQADKICDNFASTSVNNYGSLVMLAGVANTTSETNNNIADQITDYEDRISTLKDKYDDELDKYWSKFTSLETMMAKYSSYSSLFTSSTS